MTYDTASIRELNAYHLADLAGCATPDNSESAGAQMLASIRDALADHLDSYGAGIEPDDLDDDGSLHEIADAGPNVYTFTKWQQFVDLAAWQEDPSELGSDGSDMDSAASVCLFIIAERLVAALVEEATTDDDEDDA